MRAVFWIPVLFAMAVALALAAHYDSGSVLMSAPPYRIELSLNLFVLIVVTSFFLFYWLIRIAATTLAVPRQVREYRLRRRREKSRRLLIDAFTTFFEGRYAKAERAAVKALRLREAPALAAAVAARSAHELKAFDRRDRYLSEVGTVDTAENMVQLVTRTELLLDERRTQEALSTLEKMESKHTMALRLELKAHQQAKNWNQVLSLAGQLEKRGVLDPVQAWQMKRYAHIQNLEQAAHDAEELRAYWQRIPRRERGDARISIAAARCFNAISDCEASREIIEQALELEWDPDLVLLYSECPGEDTMTRIERAERWLKQSHSNDPDLLLSLGKLCARQGLWGKAESYLDASLSLEESYSAHMVLAKLYETDNPEKARAHYEKSLDLALSQLKGASGGRRRRAV
jgi:HemY protein